ncbi:MAG: hypothetical protein FWC99_02020 [Coriobacteriia bacterium]|nr:hypothetical protein [Coriobacteriia bacterium]
MNKRPSTTRRYLRDATLGQRRAAFAAAVLTVVMLIAAIALFFATEMEMLRPTPTTAAETQYLRARSAESDAIDAARAARVAVDTAPAVVAARIDTADAQLLMGQFSAAARTLDLVLRDNPHNVRALILRGNVYETSGDKRDAVDTYHLVLDYVGTHEPEVRREALRGIGYSLTSLGEGPQALDALTQAALIVPESTTLHLAAGELALELERWELAATHFYSVLRFAPNDELALDRLAVLERDHSEAASAALIALTEGTAYE